jgi:hypothetical protein
MTDEFPLDEDTQRRLKAISLIKESTRLAKEDPKRSAELRAEALELVRAPTPAI